MMDTFTQYTTPAMTYLRVFLSRNSPYSYATALSIIYIGVVAVILAIAYFLLNRFIVYRD